MIYMYVFMGIALSQGIVPPHSPLSPTRLITQTTAPDRVLAPNTGQNL
jgi:hypothetical protein